MVKKDLAKRWYEEARKGYTSVVALYLLCSRSMHGYDLMKSMTKFTEGLWKPTPGGIYPLLRKLEQMGLVESEWISVGRRRRRRVYTITPQGRTTLQRFLAEQSRLLAVFSSLLRGMLEEFSEERQAFRELEQIDELLQRALENLEYTLKELRRRTFRS